MNNDKPYTLDSLIDGMRTAMLLTFSGSGEPHARPMYVYRNKNEQDLWFMTDASATKLLDLARNPNVLVNFSNESSNRYVSIRGIATPLRNPAKARELWNVHTEAWFPSGPDDPDLVLLRVVPQRVDYWDGPSRLSYSLSLAKAIVTGERIQITGDHGTLIPVI